MLKRSTPTEYTTCHKRRKETEPEREHIMAILHALRNVKFPETVTCMITSYFGALWWKCLPNFHGLRKVVNVTVENAIALTATLRIKMYDTLPDEAFLSSNLRLILMKKQRNLASNWMKCTMFYNSIWPGVHQHVAEFFRSTSSCEFFPKRWFQEVAQLFSLTYLEENDDLLGSPWFHEFGFDAPTYQEKIRTNVLDFLLSNEYRAKSCTDGPTTIVVFALASVAVTQNLESEVFPRLFMWAYGLNGITALNQRRPDGFREILSYTLSVVLKLGSGLAELFFFDQEDDFCDTEKFDSCSDDEVE